jgi:CRP-like cAMP-binding protein
VSLPLTENLLMRALPEAAVTELGRHAEIVELPLSLRLFDAGESRTVFFPLDGVISLIRNLEDGSSVEVAMVGREGMASVTSLLGVPENMLEGLVQGRGYVARIGTAAVHAVMESNAAARAVFHRYLATYIGGVAQLAACNRLHVIVQRLAHWLLLLHDRVGCDEMSVTQEFLSRMLAARRAGINEAVHQLARSGAIEHSRNRVRVLGRKLLEEQSCECYRTSVEEYLRALGFAPVAKGRCAEID